MAGKEGQLGRGQGFNPDALRNLGNLSRRDLIIRQIPVDQYIQKLEVTDSLIIEALYEHPTLCYLLGTMEPLIDENTGEQVVDIFKPETVARPAFRLVEGSGMFGHKNKQDALRWRGMFNHSVGTAVQIEYLTRRLQSISPEQRKFFEEAGYDFSEFDKYNADFETELPELLRDTFLSSHPSRRSVDEHKKYGFNDTSHPGESTGETARAFFKKNKAPEQMWSLIRKVEDHDKSMLDNARQMRHFSNIMDAFLCYSDWTFGQQVVDLDTRFAIMATVRNDVEEEKRVLFRDCGKHFEEVFNRILGTDILREFSEIEHPEWETQVRKAYCSPSGLTIQEAFPNYPVAA